MRLLKGRSIIITGASSGIGRAAANLFSQHGANLVLVARGKLALQATSGEIIESGGNAISCVGDVNCPSTHARAVELAKEHFGRLDGAFNNAGMVGDGRPLAEICPQEWDRVIATNLTGAFLAARAQIRALQACDGGSLVFTSSFVGNSVGLPGMGAYASAKAGLGGLVKSITADYAHQNIRANALLPGGVDTPMAGNDDNKEWAASLHPVRRIGRPGEIASAALFLLSDMASFVFGSKLWVDGGNSATKIQAP